MSDPSFAWPNFFIVGAPKAGTTSVWAYLRRHPQAFLPEMKEPGFFMTVSSVPGSKHFGCIGNQDKYQRLYRKAKGHDAIGDASPGYLWDENAPGRIHNVCPDARIVILLRDPVERAFSHYFMFARLGKAPLPFFEGVQRDHLQPAKAGDQHNHMYVQFGLYYVQVLRYLEAFGEEQVKIYLFEDLQKDTVGVMSAICRHIGVDPALLDLKALAHVHNAGRMARVQWLYDGARAILNHRLREAIFPRLVREWMHSNPLLYEREKPPRDERAVKYLQSIYEPDLCRLEELLGRKLPELRSTWV
jgi:hypothetical protein